MCFRALFYHGHAELRQTEDAATRRRPGHRRQRKRKRTAIDVVDEELAARSTTAVEGESHLPQQEPQERPTFPTEGWSDDVAALPADVSTGVILHHLKVKGKDSTTKKPFTS